jgi:hypothetical protein
MSAFSMVWQAVGLTKVSQFFVKKVMEDAIIECPTSCLSGASRQEMGQIVSFFRVAEIAEI